MKLSVKGLAQTALLLTICIASQYFKNLSVYITGPIVNTTIIIAVLAVGLWSGILISMIAPVTAFLFTGSVIMAAIPLMFPVVMAGNAILAISVWFFQTKLSFPWKLPAGLALGSVQKAVFMGVVVVLFILPVWGDNIAGKLLKPETFPRVLATATVTFSVTQLITALIGSALAYVIWIPLNKYIKNGRE